MCLDNERVLKSRCERQTQELTKAQGGVFFLPQDVSLTERDKRRVQIKLKKEALRIQAAKGKLLLKEQTKKGRLNKKVLKKKVIPNLKLDDDISPSSSSMRASNHPLSGRLSQLSRYNIEVSQVKDNHDTVEVMNSTTEAIFAKIESNGLAELDCFTEWKKIADFVKVHEGTKRREFKGHGKDSKVMDLVIFYIPEGLLVHRASEGNEVPAWNHLVV